MKEITNIGKQEKKTKSVWVDYGDGVEILENVPLEQADIPDFIEKNNNKIF